MPVRLAQTAAAAVQVVFYLLPQEQAHSVCVRVVIIKYIY
jgi:hypothetical protein